MAWTLQNRYQDPDNAQGLYQVWMDAGGKELPFTGPATQAELDIKAQTYGQPQQTYSVGQGFVAGAYDAEGGQGQGWIVNGPTGINAPLGGWGDEATAKKVADNLNAHPELGKLSMGDFQMGAQNLPIAEGQFQGESPNVRAQQAYFAAMRGELDPAQYGITLHDPAVSGAYNQKVVGDLAAAAHQNQDTNYDNGLPIGLGLIAAAGLPGIIGSAGSDLAGGSFGMSTADAAAMAPGSIQTGLSSMAGAGGATLPGVSPTSGGAVLPGADQGFWETGSPGAPGASGMSGGNVLGDPIAGGGAGSMAGTPYAGLTGSAVSSAPGGGAGTGTAVPKGISGLPGLPGTGGGTSVGGAPSGTSAGSGGGSGSGADLGSLAGISALVPGLAMIGSAMAKPKLDTSKLEGIAGQLSGPGSLADLTGNTARSLIPSVSTGNIPPGAETYVHNAVNDAKQSIKSHYASMGITGSTMEGQELAAADARGQAMQFQLANELTKTGLTAAGISANDLTGSATIYDNILKLQLQQDEALQQALANFASASAIGVGLAAGGGKGGGTGIGSTLTGGWNKFLNSLGIGTGSDATTTTLSQSTDPNAPNYVDPNNDVQIPYYGGDDPSTLSLDSGAL